MQRRLCGGLAAPSGHAGRPTEPNRRARGSRRSCRPRRHTTHRSAASRQASSPCRRGSSAVCSRWRAPGRRRGSSGCRGSSCPPARREGPIGAARPRPRSERKPTGRREAAAPSSTACSSRCLRRAPDGACRVRGRRDPTGQGAGGRTDRRRPGQTARAPRGALDGRRPGADGRHVPLGVRGAVPVPRGRAAHALPERTPAHESHPAAPVDRHHGGRDRQAGRVRFGGAPSVIRRRTRLLGTEHDGGGSGTREHPLPGSG
jgi:hypothetical protein